MPRFRSARLVALALAASLSSAACASGIFSDRDRLKMALEEYNDGLRWGKVEMSCSHLPVAARQAFAERYQQLQGELQIMDYEVQRLEWDRDKGTALVRVDVSWSLKRRGIVERSVIEQRWQEGAGGGWAITQQRRITGAPLPLLDEDKATEGAPAAQPAAAP